MYIIVGGRQIHHAWYVELSFMDPVIKARLFFGGLLVKTSHTGGGTWFSVGSPLIHSRKEKPNLTRAQAILR